MNICIVIAGGSGHRMGQEIPKQFISVCDKPIIVYTLEAFQKHPQIDMIGVVCIEGWIDVVKAYSNQYGISKLKWVISGGSTGQESISNGVYKLEGICRDDDIVIIHDSIRPIVTEEVISDVIRVANERGSGITSTPYNEQVFIVNELDNNKSEKFVNRDKIRRVATPQAYRFDMLDRAYHKAFENDIGIFGSSYANTMMIELGETLYFAAGTDKNIKLTTKDDLKLFRAYLRIKSRE